MILLWFLSRVARRSARMLLAWRASRSCVRQQELLLRQLGRKAWDLRKQHVGMEDILAKLAAAESESKRLRDSIERLQEELAASARPDPERHSRMEADRRRLAALQRSSAEDLLLFGKAIDASRHHDAALGEDYGRIDDNSACRERANQQRREAQRGALNALPLALVEFVLLGALFAWGIHAVLPAFTGYHVVFDDDFRQRPVRWSSALPGIGSLEVKDGTLTLRGADAGRVNAFPSLEELYEDVSVSASVSELAPDASCGILLRHADSRFYVLEFRGDNQCRFTVSMANRPTPLCDWEPAPVARAKPGPFVVEARVRGKDLAAFIDGTLVLRRRGFEAWPGRVGLSVSPQAQVKLSRFVVRARGLHAWFTQCSSPR